VGIAVVLTDAQFDAVVVAWFAFIGWLIWLLVRGWDD
jgi:hypothetical protein